MTNCFLFQILGLGKMTWCGESNGREAEIMFVNFPELYYMNGSFSLWTLLAPVIVESSCLLSWDFPLKSGREVPARCYSWWDLSVWIHLSFCCKVFVLSRPRRWNGRMVMCSISDYRNLELELANNWWKICFYLSAASGEVFVYLFKCLV